MSQVDAREAENAKLRALVRTMVPAADLELLQKRIESMVSRTELEAALDEVARLRQAIEGMHTRFKTTLINAS